LLLADFCAWLAKGYAVSADTEDRNPAWAVDAHCACEPAPAGHKFLGHHLARCCCGPPNQTGNPVPQFEKIMASVRR
jgi:hypothetical protein